MPPRQPNPSDLFMFSSAIDRGYHVLDGFADLLPTEEGKQRYIAELCNFVRAAKREIEHAYDCGKAEARLQQFIDWQKSVNRL